MAASCPDNPTPNDRNVWGNFGTVKFRRNLNKNVTRQWLVPTPKEPFMGNVNWCTPLSPDMSTHPIVKGMLTFDAAYENGKIMFP